MKKFKYLISLLMNHGDAVLFSPRMFDGFHVLRALVIALSILAVAIPPTSPSYATPPPVNSDDESPEGPTEDAIEGEDQEDIQDGTDDNDIHVCPCVNCPPPDDPMCEGDGCNMENRGGGSSGTATATSDQSDHIAAVESQAESYSNCPGACKNTIATDRGEERYRSTDLVIEGRGFAWKHERLYRSRSKFSLSHGPKWSHNYDDFIRFFRSGIFSSDSPPNFVKNYPKVNQVFAHTGSRPGEAERYDTWYASTNIPTFDFETSVGVGPIIRKFNPPSRTYATLYQVDNPGGQATDMDPLDDTWVHISRDGWLREYRVTLPGEPFFADDPASSPDGLAQLALIEDPDGNRMYFFYEDPDLPSKLTRVVDTMGRNIHYFYYKEPQFQKGDPEYGKLKQITDFTGRKIDYTYDSTGALHSASRPSVTGTVTQNNFSGDNRKKEEYFYSDYDDDGDGKWEWQLDYNLVAVYRGNELNTDHDSYNQDGTPVNQNTPVLAWTYYGSGRVASHTIGAGSSGGGVTYTYLEDPPDPDGFDLALESQPVFRTTEISRTGQKRVYWYDAKTRGALTRYEEHYTDADGNPAVNITRHKYDDKGRRVMMQGPAGQITRFTYDTDAPYEDQHNNIVKQVVEPDPRGADQQKLVTHYVYDPIYNKPWIVVDPRGSTETIPQFSPQNGGATSPGRYKAVTTFDYQEGPNHSTHIQKIVEATGTWTSWVTSRIAHAESSATTLLDGSAPSVLGHGDVNGDAITSQVSGHVIRVESPDVVLPNGSSQIVTTYSTYDSSGRKQFEVDPRGVVTEYEYKQLVNTGAAGAQTGPLSLGSYESSFSSSYNTAYSAYKNRTQSIVFVPPAGGNGYLDKVIHDTDSWSHPNATRVPAHAPLVIETSYERDDVGNVTEQTDARGHISKFKYNDLDQVIQTTVSTPYEYTTQTIYDANDRVVETRVENKVPDLDANGQIQYDINDNIILKNAVDALIVNKYRHDILGNILREEIDATQGSATKVLVTEYKYDADERPIEVRAPEGEITKTVYNDRGLPVEVISGYGSADETSTYSVYDNLGNLIESIDGEDNGGQDSVYAVGDATTYVYDGFNRLIETIDPVGNKTVNKYDAVNQMLETAFYGKVGGSSPTNNSGSSNELLTLTRSRYDELGRVYQSDRLLGVSQGVSTNRAVVLADGSLSTDDDATFPSVNHYAGFVSTRTIFDAAGNAVEVFEDDGDKVTTVYDALGRVDTVTDAMGNISQNIYDDNSNVIEVKQTDMSFDSTTNTTTTDGVYSTHYAYDVLNRKVKTTDNIGNVFRFGYDSRGNVSVVQDARGNTKRSEYDAASRVVASHVDMRVDGTGATGIDLNQAGGDGVITTRYVYDDNSRVEYQIDDNNNATYYEYDALSRKTKATYGDTFGSETTLAPQADTKTIEQWFYDKDGNVTSFVDQNETTHVFTYDGINRRRTVSVTPDQAPVVNPYGLIGTVSQDFEYDGLGRVTKCIDHNEPADANDDVECTYTYDTLSRVLETGQKIGPHAKKYISHEYDSSLAVSGGESQSAFVFTDGRKIVYEYDENNRVTNLEESSGANIYRYKRAGSGSRLLGSGRDHTGWPLVTYSYDNVRRLENKNVNPSSSGGSGSGMDEWYGYDPSYNLKSIFHKVWNPNGFSRDTSLWFTVDSADRMTRFDRGTLKDTSGVITFEYPIQSYTQSYIQYRDYELDGVSNWKSVKYDFSDDPQEGEHTHTRNHTNFNEISTSLTTYANGPGSISESFQQDDQGNQIQNGKLKLKWDGLNRLREVRRVSDDVLVAKYLYDCDGKRVSKTVSGGGVDNDPGQDGQWLYYHSGWRVVDEYVVLAGVPTLEYQYIWGSYTDELICRDERWSGVGAVLVASLNDGVGHERVYAHGNHQYSIRMLTDEADNELVEFLYDPYGKRYLTQHYAFHGVNAVVGTWEIGYTGQRYDPETDLYYFKKRYYSVDQGRFVSRDPAGYVDGMSLYHAYFAFGGMDPLGLAACMEWHHLLSKKNMDPMDSDSLLNTLGLKLDDSVDIHSKEYGWMLSAEDHRGKGVGVHSVSNAVKQNYSDAQSMWLNKMRKSLGEGGTITKSMIDGHVKSMKRKYGLKEGVKGYQASKKFRGLPEYMKKLVNDGRMNTKGMRSSAVATLGASSKMNGSLARSFSKKGLKAAVAGAGILFAHQSYASSREAGFSRSGSAARAAVDSFSPFTVNEMSSGVQYVDSKMQNMTRSARTSVMNRQLRNAGLDFNPFE